MAAGWCWRHGRSVRGIEFAVAQQHLDHPDVDLLLQQAGGKAMAQCVQADALVDAGRRLGAIKGASQLARRPAP